MKALSEIQELLCCEVHAGGDRLHDVPVHYGCASDLMSDVLAFSRAGAVLLTGLVNIQTLQTAFIAEISAVILVRGKRPTREVIAAAQERKIPLLSTPYSMYEAAGKLYSTGLRSTMERAATDHRTSQA